MALTSRMFAGNERLQACSREHNSHITRKDSGSHVALVQNALILLDAAVIDAGELDRAEYGPSTASAVLKYKQKHAIINFTYQTTADDIVGIMTIRDLDARMLVVEAPFSLLGGGGLIPGLLFAPKLKEAKSRVVIVSEVNQPWLPWANQTAQAVRAKLKAGPDGKGAEDLVKVVTIGNGASAAASGATLQRAATLAGPLGIIILSVGHGAAGDQPTGGGENEFGVFDLGPSHNFQIGGRSAWLVGQPEPKDMKKIDGRRKPFPSATGVFYADRPPSSPGIIIHSDQENDQEAAKKGSKGAKTRLANFATYQQVCAAFTPLGLVVLLTCNVGKARGLLRKVRQQFHTPIVGYTRRVEGQMVNGRGRLSLEGVPDTDTPAGEVMIPISIKDMVLVV